MSLDPDAIIDKHCISTMDGYKKWIGYDIDDLQKACNCFENDPQSFDKFQALKYWISNHEESRYRALVFEESAQYWKAAAHDVSSAVNKLKKSMDHTDSNQTEVQKCPKNRLELTGTQVMLTDRVVQYKEQLKQKGEDVNRLIK